MYKGWVGGVSDGEVGQPEPGYTSHYDTDSSAVSSISDRNRHNPQDRVRQSLAAIWHHTHPYQYHSLAPQGL